jgi:AcrR family transcriptional regulator
MRSDRVKIALPDANPSNRPEAAAKSRSRKRVAASAPQPEKKPHTPPTGGRALATYEKLMTAAGELLEEVGFERLTSNVICTRANVTPPTFYRYFDDKYEIVAELARRLHKRQYDAFAIWLFESETVDDAERFAEWFAISSDVVRSQPGGIWTLRALRALPNLAPIRIASQRQFAEKLFRHYRRLLPDVPEELLWYQIRIREELGYVIDELAVEEHDPIPHAILFSEAARILGLVLEQKPA